METLLYSYDAVGNQLTAQNGVGAYTLLYDALNRVTVSTDVWGKTLTMSYDAVGNRTKVQDSFGGVTTYVYDGVGNLTREEFGGSGQTPLRLDFTYTALDQLGTVKRASDLAGTTTVAYSTYSYDAAGDVTNLHSTDDVGANISNFTWAYDAANRLSSEVRNGGTPTTYGYDDTNQLTNEVSGFIGPITFTYDGTGNRTNDDYDPDVGNRLASDGTWDYSYDEEGNQTKKERISDGLTWTYGFDHRNQLIWVERRTTDAGTLEFREDIEYDAFGNRVEKAVDEDGDSAVDWTQRYSLDGWKTGPQQGFVGNENWDVWGDLNGSSSLTTRYLRGNVIDQIFARLDGGDASWLLTDRLGSVRDVLDDTGGSVSRLDYDAFGNVVNETGPTFSGRYGWTGRERDVEIELQYNRARYYDGSTGRWMGEDPLGFDAGDSNLYRYLNNRSLSATDPSGLEHPNLYSPHHEPVAAYLPNQVGHLVRLPSSRLSTHREPLHSFGRSIGEIVVATRLGTQQMISNRTDDILIGVIASQQDAAKIKFVQTAIAVVEVWDTAGRISYLELKSPTIDQGQFKTSNPSTNQWYPFIDTSLSKQPTYNGNTGITNVRKHPWLASTKGDHLAWVHDAPSFARRWARLAFETIQEDEAAGRGQCKAADVRIRALIHFYTHIVYDGFIVGRVEWVSSYRYGWEHRSFNGWTSISVGNQTGNLTTAGVGITSPLTAEEIAEIRRRFPNQTTINQLHLQNPNRQYEP